MDLLHSMHSVADMQWPLPARSVSSFAGFELQQTHNHRSSTTRLQWASNCAKILISSIFTIET
jgi:hypothetical protein